MHDVRTSKPPIPGLRPCPRPRLWAVGALAALSASLASSAGAQPRPTAPTAPTAPTDRRAPVRGGLVEGTVMAIQGEEIVLDLGAARGAADGASVELWRPIKLKHPVTGKVLTDRFRIGALELVQAHPLACAAVGRLRFLSSRIHRIVINLSCLVYRMKYVHFQSD